jgi:hypothetical protein
MPASLTTRGSRASTRDRTAAASRTAVGRTSADPSETLPESPARTDRADIGLQRWNSPEWQAIRHATHHTLIDMTVFPTLSRKGVPLPNALHHTAVERGLIHPVTSRPTERLLWLNPGLRPPVDQHEARPLRPASNPRGI